MPYIITLMLALMVSGFATAEPELTFNKAEFDATSHDYDKQINQNGKLAKSFENDKKFFPNATNLPSQEDANKEYKSPQVLYVNAPVYPRELRRTGQEGRVEVMLLISESGDVLDALIYKSTNHTLNETAISTLQSWKFSPALVDNIPRQSVVIAPVNFALDKKAPLRPKPRPFDARLPSVDYLN